MRLVQADSIQCALLMDTLKKGWKGNNAKNELVLNLATNWAGTKRFSGYESYRDRHGNELDIDSEEKQN